MKQSADNDGDPSTRRGSRWPLRPMTLVLVLVLSACGGGGCDSSDDVSTDVTAIEADGEDAVDEAEETADFEEIEDADVQDSEADGDGESDGGGGGDDGDNGGGGDGDGEADGGELAFADGYDDIVDVMFGDLDDATYDGRSQCLVDPLANDQPVDPLGLRPSNRSHLLADGHDIWVVCSIEQESGSAPDGPLGALSLVDPTGRVWGEAALVIDGDNGRAGVRNLGYGQQTELIEPVGVRSGDILVPVGSTYRLKDYRVTTIYLQVPVRRPDGPWTVRLVGATDRSVELESPACNPADAATHDPWPIPADRRVVTWPELLTWVDGIDLLSVPYTPVDHCLAAPHVVGQPYREAATSMSTAIESLGVTPTMMIPVVDCDATAENPVVTAQTPVPNERLRDSYGLTVVTRCPTMPDVVGLTLADAREAIEELVDPGRGITFRVEEVGACADDNSIVVGTFPQPGSDFFGGNGLQVDLRC